jgi:hypothetical protein
MRDVHYEQRLPRSCAKQRVVDHEIKLVSQQLRQFVSYGRPAPHLHDDLVHNIRGGGSEKLRPGAWLL